MNKKIKSLFVIVFTLMFLLAIFLSWEIRSNMLQLASFYDNISILDQWKNVVTNDQKKDGAYDMAYIHNALGVIGVRRTSIGKITSDWIESRNQKLKNRRIEAEKYLNNHLESYLVRPDPKVKIMIDK